MCSTMSATGDPELQIVLLHEVSYTCVCAHPPCCLMVRPHCHTCEDIASMHQGGMEQSLIVICTYMTLLIPVPVFRNPSSRALRGSVHVP
jgi:hypothetical protein